LIAFSKYRYKLENFNFNRNYPLNTVLKVGLTGQIDREELSAKVLLPRINTETDLLNIQRLPYFRFILSLGADSDLKYNTDSNSYEPAVREMHGVSVVVTGDWVLSENLLPEQELEVELGDEFKSICTEEGNLVSLQLSIQEANISMKRLSEIMDYEREQQSERQYQEITQIDGDIKLNHVTFGYGNRKPALDDVSFTIEKGQKVALVGASGSGKSTIAKLLLKYYEPQSGDITIDGMDISEYRNDDIRRAVSYVPQNIELFSKSIYDNIRVTRQSATLDEVREAAKAADAHEFIKRLPMQYYTYLEEAGNGLSGGEKQRIALARAFLKENQFYIMDESTSNLDFATENIIFDMIYNKFRKKTMLIIAHRLATVKNCDKIIVMDKGKIIEQGTHKELLEKKGQYYRLWEMQQGNFVIREDEIKEKQCEDSVESDDKGVMSYT
jgi:ATP-binding cassette subfamily B protein